MTAEEFRLLADPAVRRLVETHLHADPVRLAFTLKCDRPTALAVCGQVKYLQRARTKLPSYHAARCIVPPLSYEQCSSEAAAAVKDYAGELCIDLTCGLGVDACHFSRRFRKVVAVERDPVLADIARYNFRLLGASNIEVVNDSAENFLQGCDRETADLIYLDPARRNGADRRVFLLRDCSPDVTALLPSLLAHGTKTVIKLSPLFDAEEALRIFHPHVSRLGIVSIGNECKELLVELTPAARPGRPEEPEYAVFPSGRRPYVFPLSEKDLLLSPSGNAPEPDALPEKISERFPWLLIPDVAFYKGRLLRSLFARYYPETEVCIPTETGFCFAAKAPADFPGKAFRIAEIHEYRLKTLRKWLRERKIQRLNLLKRNFPYPAEAIAKALGIGEGGIDCAAFTEVNDRPVMLLLEPFESYGQPAPSKHESP